MNHRSPLDDVESARRTDLIGTPSIPVFRTEREVRRLDCHVSLIYLPVMMSDAGGSPVSTEVLPLTVLEALGPHW